jgi:hypothetical protein
VAYVAEVPVFLKLHDTDPRLIPNLNVAIDVMARRQDCERIVPRKAIFYSGDREQPFAYVRTSSGWETRPLELGLANHLAVAVQSGVSLGDVVAVAEPPA